ncbi:hypothetical protein KP509_08G066700 [Ceratopteris richardii]|uniref:Prostamide/prostaglandin F synthase n=1 Tax=Ceratopteris richardii TaxID=49495 RepID=A0A8T2U6F7_CERRI|nr:hypothetical protein KP509_08G066700 [Ceratopteris richardii]
MRFSRVSVFSAAAAAVAATSLSVLFSRATFHQAMATQKGSTHVADAIKDVEVETVRGASDSNYVKVGSFWQDQTVVIHILRRFGCKLCRYNALELQKIVPTLEDHNVRIIAIGIEKLGLKEFQDGGFWNGELYIDNGKKIHNALSIKSVGILNSFKMLYDIRDALKKANDVSGNLKGDGRQLGATFVIAKGGTMLMDFRQKDFADQPSLESILEACGVDRKDYPSNLNTESERLVCD